MVWAALDVLRARLEPHELEASSEYYSQEYDYGEDLQELTRSAAGAEARVTKASSQRPSRPAATRSRSSNTMPLASSRHR